MSQAYVTIGQDRAVGIQGNARVYGHIAIVRAVRTLDITSAERYEFSFALFKKISTRIVNEVGGYRTRDIRFASKPANKSFRIALCQSVQQPEYISLCF